MRRHRPSVLMAVGLMVGSALVISACSDAEVASRNLSEAADNFDIDRRVVFINLRTGKYELVVEGKCSIFSDDASQQLEVTCKQGRDQYAKHFLGKSPDFTYFAEQLETADVDEYHYAVQFKPEVIIPNVRLDTSGNPK